jgi:hypothetical protein
VANTLPGSRLPIFVNINAPTSFYDQIDIGGVGFQWPNETTIDFSMRPVVSRSAILVANAGVAIAPADLNGNNVRYDWTSTDLSLSGKGDFFGWWGFTLPNSTRVETPEFPITITDHGPGLGVSTGAIVDGAAGYMPITFGALQKDVRFGDRRMQYFSTLVQTKVLGAVVPPDQEIGYEFELLDFLSKRLALELIKPGIDFWSRQQRTATSTQTQEITAYPDMIASLKELRIDLARTLSEEWAQVQLLVPGTPTRKVVPMPASSLNGFPNVSRNPQFTQQLRTLGWGDPEIGFWAFP